MINPQIALMGRQQDSFSALDNGLKMGQGLRQLVVGREIGNMHQIDDENEKKAFADKSMFRRELNSQLKADASARQKLMYDQLKAEAEIAKISSEAGKNNAQAGGFNLDNSGKKLGAIQSAFQQATRTGDKAQVLLGLRALSDLNLIEPSVYQTQVNLVNQMKSNEFGLSDELKQYASGITWANAKDPASLMFTTADNRLDNETSITNNILDNKTSVKNNELNNQTSLTNHSNSLEQQQEQFDKKFEFDQQKQHFEQNKPLGFETGSDGYRYAIYPNGQGIRVIGEDGQPIRTQPKAEPSIRTGIAELTGANEQTSMAIDALSRALNLSEQGIYDGYLANARSDLVGNFGGTEESRRTQEYSNIITNSALQSLKSVFGGSPTEGERAMLLKVQASAEYPKETRKAILNEAILMAQKKIESNNKQMKILGGGSQQFAQQGQAQQSSQAQPQANRPSIASLFE